MTPKVFFDGLCPVCSREIRWFKKLDKADSIEFEDIASPEFNPIIYGLTMDQVIGSIHGINEKGEIVSDLEVFRLMYNKVGLGFLVNWTKLPVLKNLAKFGYDIFAKVRPYFSSLDRKSCSNDRCSI